MHQKLNIEQMAGQYKQLQWRGKYFKSEAGAITPVRQQWRLQNAKSNGFLQMHVTNHHAPHLGHAPTFYWKMRQAYRSC